MAHVNGPVGHKLLLLGLSVLGGWVSSADRAKATPGSDALTLHMYDAGGRGGGVGGEGPEGMAEVCLLQ